MPKSDTINLINTAPSTIEKNKKRKVEPGFMMKFMSGEYGEQKEKKRINKPENVLGPRG